jgi:hypothetical protein
MACDGDGETMATPKAPSGLGAAPIAGGMAHLTWTDNSDDEDGFVIERKDGRKDGEGAFTAIAMTEFNVAQYHDAAAGVGLHTFRVAAKNAGGLSDYSNEVTVDLK